MEPLVVTDNNFKEEVLNSDIPVLVDFWAVWCGPCRALAPIVHEIAEEYAGRVKVAKLDVDNNPQTATNFGIRSIPTILIFKDGAVVHQVIGLVKKSVLTDKLDSLL